MTGSHHLKLVLLPGLGLVGGWMPPGDGDGFPCKNGGFSVDIHLVYLSSPAAARQVYEGLGVGAALQLVALLA